VISIRTIRVTTLRLAALALSIAIAQSTPAQQPASIKIDRDDVYGCTNIDQYDGLRNFEKRGDKDGLSKALPMSITLGVCVVFERGEELVVVPGGARAGLLRVKRATSEKIYFVAAPSQ
jgi:hypothetical protein